MKMFFVLLSFLFSFQALADHKDVQRGFDSNSMSFILYNASEKLSAAAEAMKDIDFQTANKAQFCRRFYLSLDAYWDAIGLLHSQSLLEIPENRSYVQGTAVINLKEQYSLMVGHLSSVVVTHDLQIISHNCMDRSNPLYENIRFETVHHMRRAIDNFEGASTFLRSLLLLL